MVQVADAGELQPVRHPDVEWSEGTDGRITLKRRKFGPVGSLLLRLVRVSPELTVHLDPLGSRVWALCDGTRTAGQVLERLREVDPDEDDLARRLGQYLSDMVRNRLMVMEPAPV